MTLATCAVLGLLGGFHIAARRLYPTALNPMSVAATAWLLPLALAASSIGAAYLPIPPRVWVVFLWAVMTAAAGILAGTGLRLKTGERKPIDVSARSAYVIVMRTWPFWALASVVQAMILITVFGLSSVFRLDESARDGFLQVGWDVLYYAGFAIVPLTVYALVAGRKTLSRRQLANLGVMLVLSAVFLLLGVQRRNFMTVAIWAAIVLAQAGSFRLRARHVAAGAIVLVGFFVLFGEIRSPYYRGDIRFYVRDGYIHLPNSMRALGNPYRYATGGFVAYADWSSSHVANPPPPLSHVSAPVRNLANKIVPSISGDPPKFEERQVPLSVNVYTYLRALREDFGLLGIVAGPFLLGLLSGAAYRRSIRLGSMRWTLLSAWWTWCWLISFFSNHFFLNATWLVIGSSVLLTTPLFRRRLIWNSTSMISDESVRTALSSSATR